MSLHRESVRRFSDRIVWAAVPFLAGILLTGVGAYWTLWSNYVRDAVSRTELEKILDDHLNGQKEQMRFMMDQLTKQEGRIETIEKEQEEIRVETGIKYRRGR
jgi:hypothetical protein